MLLLICCLSIRLDNIKLSQIHLYHSLVPLLSGAVEMPELVLTEISPIIK